MSTTNYNLETPDEKKFRLASTGFIALIAIIGGIFLIPTITQSINNYIDFGIAASKLAGIVGIGILVIGTLFALRKPLFMKWKAMIQRIARIIYKTDLPGILSVIVSNRQALLREFGESVKKMLAAIGDHNDKIAKRKAAMQENLGMAEQFLKKSNRTDLSETERQIAKDDSKHFAGEAAKDKDSLEKMMAEGDKRRKSYDFFSRMLNGLKNDTSSVSNEIERLKENLETTETWKNAAASALKLVGVDPTENMALEEARKRIAENEATVVSMILDNQSLLEKMEMKQDIMDESGQALLEQYSQKIDVMSFTNQSAEKVPARGSSFLDNYKGLIQ